MKVLGIDEQSTFVTLDQTDKDAVMNYLHDHIRTRNEEIVDRVTRIDIDDAGIMYVVDDELVDSNATSFITYMCDCGWRCDCPEMMIEHVMEHLGFVEAMKNDET